MRLTIDRFPLKEATPGVARVGDYRCFTLERPWLENEPFVSCIPAGEYRLHPFSSARFGETFSFSSWTVVATRADFEASVSATRWACLSHAANQVSELAGCVAYGESCMLHGDGAVLGSSRAATSAVLGLLRAASDAGEPLYAAIREWR